MTPLNPLHPDWPLLLVIIAAVMAAAFVAVGAWNLYRASAGYKRKHGLCWIPSCTRRVTDCKAAPEHNGPMCAEHCAMTGYHPWFAGCRTADGVPLRQKGIEGTIEALRGRVALTREIDLEVKVVRRKP